MAYDNARAEMEAQKAAVRNATGAARDVGERPPKAMLDKFREKQVPEEVGLIEMRIEELTQQVCSTHEACISPVIGWLYFDINSC